MDPGQFILGESNQQNQFEGRLENCDIATELAGQSRQIIRILTPNLEHHVYDDGHFNHAIMSLATRSKQSQIKVLVKDSAQSVKSGHRLIELARKFTSSIHIHVTPDDLVEIDNAFLLADQSGYLYKHVGTLYQGQYNFNDKLKVRELIKVFDNAWDRSKPDPELRRLFI